MSSFLYGRLSRTRDGTTPAGRLVYAEESVPGAAPVRRGSAPSAAGTDPVRHWQDVLAALVPAEVLSVHALAMTLGTTTSGSGDDTTTVITSPAEMTFVFWGMVTAAALLYLVGARRLTVVHAARGAIAAAAFVLWTMIQPSTAFDALGLELSTFLRVMIAMGGALVLGFLANVLATAADKHDETAERGGSAGSSNAERSGRVSS